MDRPRWNSLGLCSGVGLLDIAVQLGCEQLGIDCRPAALCEWDSYAAGVLLQRMEDQAVEPCPIWGGDMRDFDAVPFRGVVDVLTAGLPCQPYSVAGKRLGNSDNRSHGDDGCGPIPQFLRIVVECRPAVVFCENVPPWVRGGWFRPVGEELCRMGYNIEDPLFITAESVGASHRRERVFVLAVSDRARIHVATTARRSRARRPVAESSSELAVHSERRRQDSRRGAVERIAAGGTGGDVGHADKSRKESRSSAGRPRNSVGEPGALVEHALRTERESGTGRRGVREGSEAVGIFAPGPGADWRNVPAHLWPAIKPGLCFDNDGRSLVVDASRADQLRCAGNAVVPLQAAVAFVELMRRVSWRIVSSGRLKKGGA